MRVWGVPVGRRGGGGGRWMAWKGWRQTGQGVKGWGGVLPRGCGIMPTHGMVLLGFSVAGASCLASLFVGLGGGWGGLHGGPGGAERATTGVAGAEPRLGCVDRISTAARKRDGGQKRLHPNPPSAFHHHLGPAGSGGSRFLFLLLLTTGYVCLGARGITTPGPGPPRWPVAPPCTPSPT